MTARKYGNILTAILVILIISIIIGAGFLLYNYVIKPKIDDKNAMEAIAEFDKSIEQNNNENSDLGEGEELPNGIAPSETPASSATTTPSKKKVYYKDFVMLGYITIPKTSVKQPILDTVTPDSLNTAVAVLYPSNPQLNQPGNVVIIGHNYRNGKFFSDNNKLNEGDKILIKDNSGKELSYTIYRKFQTSEQDTGFYTRDTNGATEISLSTCTDDSKERIIILARADS